MAKKFTPEEVKAIHQKATDAAVAAVKDYLHNNPDNWYPCGFAWVVIKPARGSFVEGLRKLEVGRKGYGGGWHIWDPSHSRTQSMDAKLAGAEAYCKVLKEAGVDHSTVSADSRMD